MNARPGAKTPSSLVIEPLDEAHLDATVECVTSLWVRENVIARAPEERWVDATLAAIAFFEVDEQEARRRIDEILDAGLVNWRLVALAQDLERSLPRIDDELRPAFAAMHSQITTSLPIPQKTLMERVKPRIVDADQRYRKVKPVRARPAREGEVIVSTTSDGDETTKTAAAGDMVVDNSTEAQEQYIVDNQDFADRYTHARELDGGWALYDPVGQVLAIEITRELTNLLEVGEEFFVMASWGEQIAREGDMLVTPYPRQDQVYRVARKEFGETYALVEGER